MAEGILNYEVYNDRMRRSMWDKAFFMDKIPGAALLVDYGCADGSLIRFLHGLFPGLSVIGFDIDPAMIAEARRRAGAEEWYFSEPAEVVPCAFPCRRRRRLAEAHRAPFRSPSCRNGGAAFSSGPVQGAQPPPDNGLEWASGVAMLGSYP